MYEANLQNGLGVQPSPERPRLIPRDAARSAGDVVQLDFARSSTFTTSAIDNDPSSCTTNCVAVADAGTKWSPIAIMLEDTIQHAPRGGKALISGRCQAKVYKSSGSIAPGDPLIAVAGQTYLSADLATNARVVAICQELVASASTPTLATVDFEGETGLYTKVA